MSQFCKSGYVILTNAPASKYSTETLAVRGGCLARWHKINDGLKWKAISWAWLSLVGLGWPLLGSLSWWHMVFGTMLLSLLGTRLEHCTHMTYLLNESVWFASRELVKQDFGIWWQTLLWCPLQTQFTVKSLVSQESIVKSTPVYLCWLVS